MIMGADNKCPKCGKDGPTFWAMRQKIFMCAACMRLYNPPYMTLMRFNQGSYNKLWNLEVGDYEEFDKISDIELCDWRIRSIQDSLYNDVPRVRVKVYHLEYHGDIPCGRCVDYKFFEPIQSCLSTACKKLAKPFRPAKDIQYPPQRSKYTQWTNL